ncbi:g1305 [Coccomyxa viridis]|uniref:G1305 protein n=1 Tax=Coccomyxa viridis TaxID=1274662 RepID=A0ABP1FHQ0_9CHLO
MQHCIQGPSHVLHCPFPLKTSLRKPPQVPRRVVASAETQATEEAEKAPANACAMCGVPLDKIPRGCDQQGRVAGGVGALVGWFPIKAYRPCPAAAKAGVLYTRKGQITDQMLFGRQKQKKQ